MSKRIQIGIFGAVALFAGWMAYNYARISLEDFRNPKIPVGVSLFISSFLWAAALILAVQGIRALMYILLNLNLDDNVQASLEGRDIPMLTI
jgi:hypothetical protein